MNNLTQFVDDPTSPDHFALTHRDDPCDDCSHWIGNI